MTSITEQAHNVHGIPGLVDDAIRKWCAWVRCPWNAVDDHVVIVVFEHNEAVLSIILPWNARHARHQGVCVRPDEDGLEAVIVGSYKRKTRWAQHLMRNATHAVAYIDPSRYERPEQRQMLETMAGCSRFTYNRAVSIRLAEGSTQRSKYRIRDRIVTLQPRRKGAPPNTFFADKPWLLECPKSVRAKAVEAAVANVKACFSNRAAGNIQQFDPPFRTKKKEQLRGWSMEMDKLNVSRDENRLFVFKDTKGLGEMKYRCTKQLLKLMPGQHPAHDPKIQKSAFGEYFLVLPVARVRAERPSVYVALEVDEAECRVQLNLRYGPAVASLDPGVRKTLTTYSPELRESFMLGHGHAAELVQRFLVPYDKLQSMLSTGQIQGAKAVRKAKAQMLRLRKSLFYRKKEYRDQVANFLARRYTVLLVPKLGTGDLALCAGRKLKTKVVRQMMTLGHSAIFTRLREKCEDYDTQFLQVKEHYTSQTCPQCGVLSKCDETFRCKSCRFCCDRDVVGAANILLKAVRKTNPSLRAEMGS